MENNTNTIDLKIEVAEFLSYLYFNSEDEKKECIEYINAKGLVNHITLANYIGLDENNKIKYSTIANLYQYDKRIRNILYKYIALIEERIRSFIGNKFEKDYSSLTLTNKQRNKIEDIGSLSIYLNDIVFDDIKKTFLSLDEKIKNQMFSETENLETRLYDLQVLRNHISHHRILIFREQYFDSKNINIKKSIDNLIGLLHNNGVKEKFKKEINEAKFERKKEYKFEREMDIPSKAIINVIKM